MQQHFAIMIINSSKQQQPSAALSAMIDRSAPEPPTQFSLVPVSSLARIPMLTRDVMCLSSPIERKSSGEVGSNEVGSNGVEHEAIYSSEIHSHRMDRIVVALCM
jgi:hypothetical protein